ncbi:hypothetical protein BCD48_15765 [Pseudofrankia sp. BMG5.36]|nr:hypothetical protein BCD48_15765 [Pseudofrankia sp. BMG5.36]
MGLRRQAPDPEQAAAAVQDAPRAPRTAKAIVSNITQDRRIVRRIADAMTPSGLSARGRRSNRRTPTGPAKALAALPSRPARRRNPRQR